jgi:hypothetical protein
MNTIPSYCHPTVRDTPVAKRPDSEPPISREAKLEKALRSIQKILKDASSDPIQRGIAIHRAMNIATDAIGK